MPPRAELIELAIEKEDAKPIPLSTSTEAMPQRAEMAELFSGMPKQTQ